MAKHKMIVNRFRELLAIKERHEKRKLSQRTVAEETGLSKSTVDRYARNEITRYDEDVVLTLCQYLGCQPGDLLVIEEVEGDDTALPEIETPELEVA